MVTRGYISAWANKKNVVDVIDLQHGRGYPSSIMNASVVSYVYDPQVMSLDLESEYGRIESDGVVAINRLRNSQVLERRDLDAVVAFLDMHLHRGRYADRANVRVPAVLVMKDGTSQDAELKLGDMLILAQQHPETLRLTSLGLAQWTWRLYPVDNLATGDGAVLLWRKTADADLSTVTFPLSPTQLLVIGDPLPGEMNMNAFLARNCRRWMVGQRGTLPLDMAPTLVSARVTGQG
ncbi:hypothetical protein GCM10010910_03920 [Microbacterium nanhaiense]|uniref:Uncharacterized protein n=1 Tax=Microbacterium nanhaiense TaxID=1301026 RepID=A0ABQ2MW74_9MICO|nr:DUF4238 domain-containing protein [Microbacterium nanhaiense]GGO59882.1 hypothetical protein GCM10010910_03920 [Microbacterium nanhaiense]